MGHLSLALTDVLASENISQSSLAVSAGLHAPHVNRACRGFRVNAKTITAIAGALPDHKGRIVAAWLLDQIPPGLTHAVDVNAISSRLSEQPPAAELPPELDAETRALILWLAHQAVIHTAVRDALRSLKRAAEAVTL